MDVAVIGGGIVGTSAAALLAEAGADVVLSEQRELGAGASGRNSGVVQHPFDPVLGPLYEESLEMYRALESADGAFPLDRPPDGLLSVSPDPEVIEASAADTRDTFPELEPEVLSPDDLAEAEPALAPGLHGYLTHTGWAVPPMAAVQAFAERARAAGARFVGWPESFEVEARLTLVAAGPWTPGVVDPKGGWRPIQPVWGVVADVELELAPRHVLEEAGIPERAEALGAGEAVPHRFSLVTHGGHNGLGSSFTPDEPDQAELAKTIVERGRRFVTGIRAVRATRACARPVSADGRPLMGRLSENLYVCAGHGPWGISTGPASARLVADAILGRDPGIPAELSAERFPLAV